MTPSLEGLPTKAKEAPSLHEIRLVPLDTNPVFQCLGGSLSMQTDLSTWDNCLLWEFNYNSIRNTSILGGDIKIAAIYKIWRNDLNIATVLAFPWILVAITKINY